MRNSGKCPDHWSSAMPPPRIQSDPTGGQPADGDHGHPCVLAPHPSFCPPVPPAQPASKRTQMRTCGFYTKYIRFFYIVQTHPHLLPFLLPQASHLHQVLGQVKNLLPATTNVLFSSLKPAVLCLYRGALEGGGEMGSRNNM